MNPQSALIKYAAAVAAVKEYTEANKPIFDQHTRLMGTLIDAENELRDAVAESGTGVSIPLFNVVITPQTQRTYDEEILKTLVNPEDFNRIVKVISRPSRISISEVKTAQE